MAISKQQPMREAEIELTDAMNTTQNDVNTLAQNLGNMGTRITNIENDIRALPVLEYGVSENNVVPAASSIGVDILFTDEKQSTPYVLVSVECVEGEESPISNCYGIIISASTTGFSVRLHNLDSVNAETININWLAIGA